MTAFMITFNSVSQLRGLAEWNSQARETESYATWSRSIHRAMTYHALTAASPQIFESKLFRWFLSNAAVVGVLRSGKQLGRIEGIGLVCPVCTVHRGLLIAMRGTENGWFDIPPAMSSVATYKIAHHKALQLDDDPAMASQPPEPRRCRVMSDLGVRVRVPHLA
jgi:hypothetical protein